METSSHSSSKWSSAEHRLSHFGLEMRAPQNQPETPKEEKSAETKPSNDGTANKERKEQLKKAEVQDAQKENKRLQEIEKKMEGKEEERSASARQWLEEFVKELNIDPKSVTIGKTRETVRMPTEQYGIYVNGKHVADVWAGVNAKTGQLLKNSPDLVDTSRVSDMRFTKGGFRYQLMDIDEKIQKAAKSTNEKKPESKEQDRSATAQQWLEGVAKELGVDPKTVKLVEPRVVVRTPAEQYGISVDGKYVGEINAAFDIRGREINDPAKADRSIPPFTNFTEAGFKEQIKALGVGGTQEK